MRHEQLTCPPTTQLLVRLFLLIKPCRDKLFVEENIEWTDFQVGSSV